MLARVEYPLSVDDIFQMIVMRTAKCGPFSNVDDVTVMPPIPADSCGQRTRAC